MFAAGTNPDLKVIGLRPDKSELAISQFVGFDDELKEPALCPWLALKPFHGRRRVGIVDDADELNIHSANCLLKTLEEPPPSAVLILIGTSPSRQLQTIRSRSQIVRFRRLDEKTIAKILLGSGAITDEKLARQIADLSEGSLERAGRLADPELWGFREQLFAALAARPLDGVRLARAVQTFVDEAGKEPAKKRERLRTVIDFGIEHFRARMLQDTCDLNALIQALDASLTALEHVDRNANIGLVVQAWCEALARTARDGTSQTRFAATVGE
jgi:DNA polymerase-3 subunit delta'